MVRSRPILALSAAVALAIAGSAHATVFTFDGVMTGLNEVPPNASTAFGFTTASLDDVLDSLTVDVTWSGLTGGNPAAAHIHCCTAPGTTVGVAVGFPSFPATTSGVYHHVFDLSDPAVYTSGFLTNFGGGTAAGSEAALLNGLLAGQAYSNIHNTLFPGGEIRALLAPVPEAGTWALMLTGFGLMGAALRRRARLRPA